MGPPRDCETHACLCSNNLVTRTEQATVIKQLDHLQRLVCISVTGAMSTTPTAALEVMLNLPPLHDFIKAEAASAAIRIKSTGMWHGKKYGHTKILEICETRMPLLPAPHDRVPIHVLQGRNYTTQVVANGVRNLNEGDVTIYCDGSKSASGSGSGVYSPDLAIRVSYPLGPFATVLQAETMAVSLAAMTALGGGAEGRRISILTDSLTTIKYFSSRASRSKTTIECHELLRRLAGKNNVFVLWIKGHSNNHGNDTAR